MSYEGQMERAVKKVLKPQGYKYDSEIYAHIKPISTDIDHQIRYSVEHRFRAHYLFLGFAVQVISKSLNEIIYELTDGLADWRNYSFGPIFQTHIDDENEIYTEFLGERTMEENISCFVKVYENMIVPILDKYTTQKSIYTCAIHDNMAVKHNRHNSVFIPIAYYIEGEFDKAIEYIDSYVLKQRQAKIEYPNVTTLDDRIVLFEAYKKNLLKWIQEKRTFKVDSEYLPVFPEKTDSSSEPLLGRVFDFLKKKVD